VRAASKGVPGKVSQKNNTSKRYLDFFAVGNLLCERIVLTRISVCARNNTYVFMRDFSAALKTSASN
jgi:hypothetical protein